MKKTVLFLTFVAVFITATAKRPIQREATIDRIDQISQNDGFVWENLHKEISAQYTIIGEWLYVISYEPMEFVDRPANIDRNAYLYKKNIKTNSMWETATQTPIFKHGLNSGNGFNLSHEMGRVEMLYEGELENVFVVFANVLEEYEGYTKTFTEMLVFIPDYEYPDGSNIFRFIKTCFRENRQLKHIGIQSRENNVFYTTEKKSFTIDIINERFSYGGDYGYYEEN